MKRFGMILLFLVVGVFAAEKLIAIQQIFRHGARYPYNLIKNDPISEQAAKNNELRELTPQGKRQHYLLGKSLYRKYWKRLFGGTQFQHQFHPQLIYTYSTNTNRTIQSAMAQLVGLLQDLQPEKLPTSQLNNSLPPFPGAHQLFKDYYQSNFYIYGHKGRFIHNVPVHTEPATEEISFDQKLKEFNKYFYIDYLIKILDENCPLSQKIVKENLKSNVSLNITSHPLVQQYFRRVSQELGYHIGLDAQGTDVCDSFYVAQSLGAPTLKIFQDPQMLRTSKFLRLSYQILEDVYTDIQRRIGSTWILQKLISNMNQAIEGKGARITLMSTHDWTLIVMLGALRMFTLNCIIQSFQQNTTRDGCISEYTGFAASLVFELWQRDGQEHIVKIVYNGVEKKIPVCGNRYYCTLGQFTAWAESLYTDPNRDCQMPDINLNFSLKSSTKKRPTIDKLSSHVNFSAENSIHLRLHQQ